MLDNIPQNGGKNMKKIYCRDKSEMESLRAKYPEVEAEWVTLPEDKKDYPAPLVCRNNEPLDDCDIGEEFID